MHRFPVQVAVAADALVQVSVVANCDERLVVVRR